MRMTWEEIKGKYPNQWVGLVNVEYVEDDGVTIESAVVKYSDKTGDELFLTAMKNGEALNIRHTNVNSQLQLGMVEVMG